MQNAATNMKRVNLELGGKGPVIVCDDADVDKAVEKMLHYGLWNCGQFCGSPTRLIVHESVYAEFVSKMIKGYESRKPGSWRDQASTLGPIISQKQVDKVMDYIGKGKKEAELLTGGSRIDGDGFFV